MNKIASIITFLVSTLVYVTSAAGPACAADWPDRPIRIVVPFAAGGPTDIVTRKLAERLSPKLGQPVLVDNRPGGNTLIGTEAVLNAPPDGYTVLMTNTQLVQLPALMPNISYLPERDFLPVAQICAVPLVLTINANIPSKDVSSFVDYLRKNSGTTNYASTGYGNTANIYAEEFRRTYNLKAEHIVYKGESPIITDFITNRIQWYFATPSQVLPHIKDGKLRPLAVTGTKRLANLPDVPTLGEVGAPTFDTVGWFGMFLPVRTPRSIADRLSKEVLAVARDPEFVKFIDENMFGPQGEGIEQFAPEIARISAIWTRMIKENQIRIQ